VTETGAFAIVTSGGKGERMGGAPKLEAELLGKPLIIHTLLAFEDSPRVTGVVLTVPADRLADWTVERLRLEGAGKVTAVVAGGETRQESVALALEMVPADAELVMVHDGARPLVTTSLIEAACAIPEGFEGVVVAMPLTDTVKKVSEGEVQSTPDRSSLVAVQTPQCFRGEVIREAHRFAREASFTATDDSSLVERAGGRVAIIEGSRDNFKVTWPEDIKRAEMVLEARRGGSA